MNLELVQSPRNPGSAELQNLELQNPLPAGNKPPLHQTQTAKGLPSDIYLQASRKLMGFLKAGGYREIRCTSQDYTVSAAYRRLVGFRPADSKSEELFKYLDHLRSYARTSLPEDSRARTADDFARILGEATDHHSLQAEMMERVLRESLDPLPRGIEPLRENGKLIGVIDRRQGRPMVHFLDPTEPKPTILKWEDLIRRKRLNLRLKLGK